MLAANPWKLALVLMMLAPALAGCKKSSALAEPEAAPPEVGVLTVTPQPRTIVRELPGRVAPTRVADVRPRVSGIVISRLFNQGSDVEAGDVLYQIDPRPFEVELQAAQAALEKAKAALRLAIPQVTRSAALAKTQAISTAQHEIAVATVEQAKAEVAAREADVARARLNLDYATVRAPISGRIGAARVSEGALVVQNDTTNLATIQQLDPIYADFTQSASELSALRRALASGELERIEPNAAKVRLMLDDGSLYPYTGKLLFSEARVDTSTGKVTLRGTFLNPDRELLPGMYVRVLLEQGVDSDAISLPEQAIQRNGAGGAEVFVVKEDNRVAVQPVRLGPVQGGQWLVLDGLKAGDRVVVDGFQKFAAGDTVTPRTVTAEASPPESATTLPETR